MSNIYENFPTILISIVAITLVIIIGLWVQDRWKQRQDEDLEFEEYEEMNNRETLSGLTKLEESVLDIYVQSNIKIPYEILEELRYLQLNSEDEIFNYIENQRLHWKLENSKKPYRRK